MKHYTMKEDRRATARSNAGASLGCFDKYRTFLMLPFVLLAIIPIKVEAASVDNAGWKQITEFACERAFVNIEAAAPDKNTFNANMSAGLKTIGITRYLTLCSDVADMMLLGLGGGNSETPPTYETLTPSDDPGVACLLRNIGVGQFYTPLAFYKIAYMSGAIISLTTLGDPANFAVFKPTTIFSDDGRLFSRMVATACQVAEKNPEQFTNMRRDKIEALLKESGIKKKTNTR